MRKQEAITDLIPNAQQILDFHGQGDVTILEAVSMKFVVFLVLGHHCVRTLVQGARFLPTYLPTIQVVITGGIGRGTRLLQDAIANFLMLEGLPALKPADLECEATMIERLFRDLGVRNPMELERCAPHTAANYSLSKPFLEKLGAYPNGKILVLQAPPNRRRASACGERVFGGSAEIRTLHLSLVDLSTLCEKDLVIELFRLFGLRRTPQSELRVCAEFDPSVLDSMPLELRVLANDTERRFHSCLENSPRLLDHFRDALLEMPESVGGRS